MNNEESWEIMCAMETFFCTEKYIKTQENSLIVLKKEHSETKKELEEKIQDYFRKNQEGEMTDDK